MKSLLLALTISQLAFPAQTARVLFVKGTVTQLSPGAKQAKQVKKGDVYTEDTSVLTGDKSIVRLKFADKSVMNLGPKSKVVVSKMPKKKPNMISLLTGSIKAEVDKKDTGKNKMIVKTRSAVMGIRGTKFQASYNAVNHNTSLVTVEGKVAMVKKDVVAKQVVKEEVVETAAENTLSDAVAEPVQKEVVQKVVSADEELDLLDKALDNTTEAVEVDAGKFAGVQETATKPSVPVKIAPKQYEVLAKSMGSKNKAEDVMETSNAEKEVKSLEKSAVEGQMVQKPGGYIDFETGLYVPPSDEAKLDKKTGTFKVEKEVGQIDEETGGYIPPKGVKLDAKKGFVVDKKELAKVASKDQEKILALVQEKNEKVQEVNKIKAESISGGSSSKARSAIGAELVPYSQVLTLDTPEGGESEFLSESAMEANLTYTRAWNKDLRTIFKLGFVEVKYDQSEGNFRESEDEADTMFVADTLYTYNKNWTLSFELMDRPYFFVYPGDNGDAVIQPVSLASINIGGSYNWRTYNEIALTLGGKIMIFAPDEANLEGRAEEIESFGFSLFINGDYNISKTMSVGVKGFMQLIQHTLPNSDDAEFERFNLGSQLVFNYNL
jgi:hypothetical protein